MMTAAIPSRALDEHNAIVGKVGSGKTYTAKGFVEHLLFEGRRVCILDPTGAWWGLRSNAAGDGPGFPVAVFGGEHADLPVTVEQAEPLAHIIASSNLPTVIDLSGFTTSDRRRFATRFLDALYHKNRDALHLIVDEADEFAPQKPGPDQTTLLNRLDQIVRRGRVKGFRVMMITQRPAVLNKDVLSQASTLIAMKLTSPQDRNALGAWIEGQADREEGKKLIDSLPRLERGQGWVWWPEGELLELTTFPKIGTFDSSRTPEAGQVVMEPTGLAEVDLSEFQAVLDAPKAEKVAKASGISHEEAETMRAKACLEGVAEGRRDILNQLAPIVQQLVDLKGLGDVMDVAPVRPLPPAPPVHSGPAIDRLLARPAKPAAAPRQTDDTSLLPMSRKIIDAIHAAYPVSLSFAAAAARAGASKRSSQFRQYRQQVEASQELILADGRLRSAAGFAVGPIAPSGDPIELWAKKLPRSYGEMLRTIARAHEPIDKEQVALRSGVSPTSSGLTAGLRELIDLGLVERHDQCYGLSVELQT